MLILSHIGTAQHYLIVLYCIVLHVLSDIESLYVHLDCGEKMLDQGSDFHFSENRSVV